MTHFELSNCSLQVSDVDLGSTSEVRQEVVTPLGQGQQSLVEQLHLRQLGLQLLKPTEMDKRVEMEKSEEMTGRASLHF